MHSYLWYSCPFLFSIALTFPLSLIPSPFLFRTLAFSSVSPLTRYTRLCHAETSLSTFDQPIFQQSRLELERIDANEFQNRIVNKYENSIVLFEERLVLELLIAMLVVRELIAGRN